MTDEEISAYITETHTYLTVSEMAEDLAPLTVQMISYYCRALGVQPIKVKQRNINFILENHTKMSAAKIAKLLGISEQNLVNNYGKELGINFPKEEIQQLKEPTKRSDNGPAAALANYREEEAGHYHPPKIDKKGVDEKLAEIVRHEKRRVERENNSGAADREAGTS